MEYIYMKRGDDDKIIADYKTSFEMKPIEELVQLYNKEAKCGIVGVHQQALYLIALMKEFKERLKESPVYLSEYVLGLVGQIELENGQIRILER